MGLLETDAEKVLDLLFEEQDEEDLRRLLKNIKNPTAVAAAALGLIIERYERNTARRLHGNLMKALVD